MTRIVRSGDCGNSPKNVLLENFAIALARRDTKTLLAVVTGDIRWDVVGSEPIVGKAAFAAAIERLKRIVVAKLVIHHVVSHGRAGSVNGSVSFADGVSADFCHVLVFGNAKGTQMREITSYVVRRT